MAEEKGENAQQDVAMFWDFGSGPDVRDRWQDNLQRAVGDRASTRMATLARWTPWTSIFFIKAETKLTTTIENST